MKRLPIAAAVLCLLPAAAGAATWNVDHTRSRLGFTVQWSGEAFNAIFKSWTADITFDPADLPHSRAVVSIDLASEASDSPDNDDGLKGPQGFATGQFPAAKFETTGFTAKGGGAYEAAGRLTLHGMTKPIALPFNLTITGATAHMTAKAVVSRLDFGLGSGEWASEKVIAHAVTITVDLTATKAR